MTGVIASLGARLPVVELPASITADAQATDPSDATATITIKRDGTWANGAITGTWVTPNHATIGDLYDVKFDYTGDALSSGLADNTYGQLNTDRAFTNVRDGVGVRESTGTFSISRTGVGSALDTCTGTVRAEVV